MKYRNRSDYSGFTPAEQSFPKLLPKYGYVVDKETGEKRVEKVGSTNVYEEKQAALQDVLIYNVIDRINRTGDMSLLGENLGGFIDCMDLPKSLLEAENIRIKSEELFRRLPAEERSKYQNNIGLFLKDVNDKLKNKALAQKAAAREEALKQQEPAKEVAND